MFARACIGCWLAAASLAAAAEGWVVPQVLWERPRTAAAVMTEPAVRQALSAYLAQPGSQLVIHHGIGQNPLLDAEELRAWLMALAVDAGRVRLLNDLKPGEPIMLEVTR